MDRFYWRDEDWATQIEWIPVLHSRALPGGVVERGAYDAWKAEILEGLAAAGPLDGLFFDIHGAMSVQGMDDAEGDLINAIRGVIGPEPMVSASMDLHGNVSQDLFDGCDILTCYRLAPHEDALESRPPSRRLQPGHAPPERPAQARQGPRPRPRAAAGREDLDPHRTRQVPVQDD